MPPPQFSERQFEFCVSYQLQSMLGAYIVGGMPVLPSQVKEALTGYDAAFRFRSGRSLILQYKVAYHAEQARGAGAAVFRLWGGPYLRAELLWHHKEGYRQHNALVELSRRESDVCYCGPCFHTSRDLARLFDEGKGQQVLDRSIAAPVGGLPKLFHTVTHSITYPEDSRAFRLHSQPSEPHEAASLRAHLLEAEPREWGRHHFEQLLGRAEEALALHEVELPEPEDTGGEPPGTMTRLARALQGLGSVLVLVPSRG